MKQGEPHTLVEKLALDFPILESLEAQMTLIDIVQNSGHSSIIDQIICKDIETGLLSKNIGLKVFAEALHDDSLPIKNVGELVSSLEISSEKAQKTWDSLEAKFVDTKSKQVKPNCMLMLSFVLLMYSI